MVRFQRCRMLVLPTYPTGLQSLVSMVAQSLGSEPFFTDTKPRVALMDTYGRHHPHL